MERFVGSRIAGHRDVPVLGWFRPTSAEVKAGVPVDVELLKLGLAKAAMTS